MIIYYSLIQNVLKRHISNILYNIIMKKILLLMTLISVVTIGCTEDPVTDDIVPEEPGGEMEEITGNVPNDEIWYTTYSL